MHRFQLDREMTEDYERQIKEKMYGFEDLRQLLKDSGMIAEAILENGRPYNPSKHSFFLPTSKVNYALIEWKDIEHSSLGRRLTSYFDQLKAERRLLAS